MDEQVNIPALLFVFNGGTWFMKVSAIRLCALAASRVIPGKSGVIKLERCLKKQPRLFQFIGLDHQEKPLELN